jgi:tetratricopeptide (TPR) repeat protein
MSLAAQDSAKLNISGRIDPDMGKIAGIRITILKEGKQIDSFELSKKLKYEISCEFQAKYEIIFEADDYVKQSFSINTHVPEHILKKNSDFPEVELDLTHFRKFEDGDYYMLDGPVAIVAYNEKIDHFEYDYDDYENLVTQLKFDNQKSADKLAQNESGSAEEEKRKAYEKAILNADQLLADNEHLQARKAYQQALIFQPREPYPKNKIIEIDNYRKEQYKKQQKVSQKDIDYDNLIVEADKLHKLKKYTEAKVLYQKALQLKPEEKYPQYKMEDIETIFVFQKKDENYRKIISQADELLEEKNYTESKKKYSEALSIKPDEKYPKRKIDEINGILAYQEKNKDKLSKLDAAYNDFITRADRLFAEENYLLSRADYVQASQIKPSENYPNQKIAEIDGIIRQQQKDRVEKAANNEAYERAIANADKQFDKERYSESKDLYTEALSYKPEESYPKTRIAEIGNILEQLAKEQAERESTEKSYADAIEKADQHLDQLEYIPAKSFYGEALSIKPEEIYPQKKIEEINGILASMEQEEQEKAQREADYLEAIKQGDKSYELLQYVFAKASYEKALGIKPNESHPETRIAEIDKILAEQAKQIAEVNALNKRYKETIAKADELFTKKAYPESKSAYEYALTIKSEEQYPKDRISEIKQIINQLENDRLKQEELERNYNDAITKGDELFNKSDYINAKTAFQNALIFKPSESYPKGKIASIEAILARMEKAEMEKVQLEADYQNAIAEGDRLFGSEAYTDSKTQYKLALQLKPSEVYPQAKIDEIDLILKEQAKNLAELNALNKKYENAIGKGDLQFNKESYIQARSSYEHALTFKPKEQYPKDKIADIEQLLIDLAKKKKARENLEASYSEAIKKADNLFNRKDYTASLGYYEEALEYKPDESYPKKKIAELQRILAELEVEEREKNLRDESYKAEISNADLLFNQQKYDDSKASYLAALKIKPAEKYPQNRIAEIDKIIESLAQDAEERARKEKEYNELIKQADAQFDEKAYRTSKDSYEFAQRLLPDKTYPQKRIDEINTILNQLDESKKQALLQQQYEQLVKKGDREYKRDELLEAKLSFRQALDLKPAEEYPREMIAKIEEILANQKHLIEQNSALEQEYEGYITKADNAFDNEVYEDAKSYYQKALGLKPDAQYPQNRIKEINWIQEEKAKILISPARESEPYLKAIENADNALDEEELTVAEFYYTRALGFRSFEVYPKNQMKKIKKLRAQIKHQAVDEKYNTAIRQGDGMFDQNEFPAARFYFKKAHALKPDELLPMVRIKDTEEAIRLMKSGELDKDYNKAIKFGTSALNNKEYTVAEFYFERAYMLRSEELYPVQKLEEIAAIKGNLESGEKLVEYQQAIKMADGYYNSGDLSAARYFYNKAISYDKDARYPKDQLSEIKAFYDPEYRQREASFKNALSRADKAFKQNDFELAKMMYQKAKEIKPGNSYVRQQLEKIALK